MRGKSSGTGSRNRNIIITYLSHVIELYFLSFATVLLWPFLLHYSIQLVKYTNLIRNL